MNIKKATATRLLAIPELRAIVADRIYRGRLPRDQAVKPPHVIIWLLENERVYNHDGYSGLSEALLQISCFSYDPDEADAMATIILASLEKWPSECDDIDSVLKEDEADLLEEGTDIFHVPFDYRISYHE
jgi:hypothetical protein